MAQPMDLDTPEGVSPASRVFDSSFSHEPAAHMYETGKRVSRQDSRRRGSDGRRYHDSDSEEDRDRFTGREYDVTDKGMSCCSARDIVYFPYILTGYLQLSVNLLVIAFVAYIVYTFLDSVQSDVEGKVEEYSIEILNEIALCSRNYVDNRCDDVAIPAMKNTCMHWQACMNRDPKLVSRTKVSAETLAQIINAFIEPLSYKTMLFFTIFICGFLVSSNVAFHFARTKMPVPQVAVGEVASGVVVDSYTRRRTPNKIKYR